MKKAFTLVELLVVIGILGILMGAMVVGFGGAKDKAEGAVCKSRLHNLAQACNAMQRFPFASTVEYATLDNRQGKLYGLRSGWIGNSNDHEYRSLHKSIASGGQVSCYTDNDDEYMQALTNGTMYAALDGKIETYVCPLHAKESSVVRKGLKPRWSYAMNSYFGYDYSQGAKASVGSGDYGKEKGKVSRATNRLLFAEIPYTTRQGASYSTSASPENDCVLQYDRDNWSGSPEQIGANHRSGRDYIAHVAFVNGEVKEIKIPSKASEEDMIKLTRWLCEGYEVSYLGDKGWELTDPSVEN